MGNGNSVTIESKELSEIQKRLSDYQNGETTAELYDFGKMLLQEEVDRAHWLDSKAGVLTGFAGAILALLVSSSSSWKAALNASGDLVRYSMFVGIICILAASALAFVGLLIRNFDWIDEKEVWLAKDYLDFPDQLRRYYLFAMYRSMVSHERQNQDKSTWLVFAQMALAIGGFALAVVSLAVVHSTLWP